MKPLRKSEFEKLVKEGKLEPLIHAQHGKWMRLFPSITCTRFYKLAKKYPNLSKWQSFLWKKHVLECVDKNGIRNHLPSDIERSNTTKFVFR